jgi:hypothetical protein
MTYLSANSANMFLVVILNANTTSLDVFVVHSAAQEVRLVSHSKKPTTTERPQKPRGGKCFIGGLGLGLLLRHNAKMSRALRSGNCALYFMEEFLAKESRKTVARLQQNVGFLRKSVDAAQVGDVVPARTSCRLQMG